MSEPQKTSRFRLFIENFLAYGLGGILTSLIPFVMMPIMTRLIPNSGDYGVIDIYSTITSFGVALSGLGMYDAAFRFYFDKDTEQHHKAVCTTASSSAILTSLLIFIVFVVMKKQLSVVFFASDEYSYLVLMAGISILLSIISNSLFWPIKFENKRRLFLIINISTTIMHYIVTITLLLKGFVITAIPLSGIITSLILIVFYYIKNKKWYNLSFFDKNLLKQLLKFGMPLVPVFLVYWVFNSMDRVMIMNMLGAEQSGIYAIGAKVAMVSQLIYTAFAGGWQYFAFSTMKDNDQTALITKVYEALLAISLFVFILSFPFTKFVFTLIFKGDYVNGYIVFPYLFLAPLLLMIYQTIGNQLLVIKKTWLSFVFLSAGAGLNVALNYILISLIGIEGAAIATLVGYFVSVVFVYIACIKMKLIYKSNRSIFVIFMSFALFALQRLIFDSVVAKAAISFIGCLVIVVIYRDEVKLLINKLQDSLKLKNSNNNNLS